MIAFPLASLLILGLAADPAPPEAAPPASPPRLMGGSVASLITDRDYPRRARFNHEEGITAFELVVGSGGSPTSCRITTSSGSAMLDRSTCNIMMNRATFHPARDARGHHVTGTFAGRVHWVDTTRR